MRLLLMLTMLLLSCGRDDSRQPAPRDVAAEVSARVASLRSWAPRCSNGMLTKEEQRPANGDVSPTVPGSCDDGDFLLFGGLACLAGERDQCDHVRDSQGSDGRVWRSPFRVGKEAQNAFSRDMAVGFLAYVAVVRDAAALERWVEYVRENDGLMCPSATDNRCDSMAGIRTLAKIVGDEVGADVSWGSLSTYSRTVYDAQLYSQALVARGGYPLHLVASQILVLRAVDSDSVGLRKTAQKLRERQGQNSLFAYVAGDKERSAHLLLQYSLTERPSRLRQWSLERADSEEAWRESIAWEWITVGSLILR